MPDPTAPLFLESQDSCTFLWTWHQLAGWTWLIHESWVLLLFAPPQSLGCRHSAPAALPSVPLQLHNLGPLCPAFGKQKWFWQHWLLGSWVSSFPSVSQVLEICCREKGLFWLAALELGPVALGLWEGRALWQERVGEQSCSPCRQDGNDRGGTDSGPTTLGFLMFPDVSNNTKVLTKSFPQGLLEEGLDTNCSSSHDNLMKRLQTFSSKVRP